MNRIRVLAVNISEEKGTIKRQVNKIYLDSMGVQGDAHAGPWNRQVSLLGLESVRRFEKQAGRKIQYGEFAENITTDGMELYYTNPLDRFVMGGIELEVTQIGKQCHGDNCAIFREVGNCVMPKEGIFCRVLQEGELRAGDILEYHPKTYRTVVITLSDRASSGFYEDKSGPEIERQLSDYFTHQSWKHEIERQIFPDDVKRLNEILIQSRNENIDLIFTTGGTGIGPKDFTPEVVKPLLDKEIQGIMEMIRFKYGMEKPNALLSRGVAGIMGNSLIFTLPGSLKAVKEYMYEILKGLKHMIYMQHGLDMH